jgi:hypothetical protein
MVPSELSAADLVRAWEAGLAHPQPIERALCILGAVESGGTRDVLGQLTIGQRDARLFALRAALFGREMACFARCPACADAVEFTLATDALASAGSLDQGNPPRPWAGSRYEVLFRLPDSLDLLAARDDPADAHDRLLQSCILEARHDGQLVPASSLPPEVVEALGEAMAECDPQADIRINLSCPACAHGWTLVFDIEAFLWAEINTHARRLLNEVHRLARAYGWREADILALSPGRRQFYLDSIAAGG